MGELVKVPTKRSIFDTAKTGLKAGIIGGLGVSLGSTILGATLGPAVGGILSASMLPADEGKIVATNAVMDSVIVMLMGGGGR